MSKIGGNFPHHTRKAITCGHCEKAQVYYFALSLMIRGTSKMRVSTFFLGFILIIVIDYVTPLYFDYYGVLTDVGILLLVVGFIMMCVGRFQYGQSFRNVMWQQQQQQQQILQQQQMMYQQQQMQLQQKQQQIAARQAPRAAKPAPKAASNDVKFCSACGAQINKNAKFCASCGTPQ
jgi:hypothetical protein